MFKPLKNLTNNRLNLILLVLISTLILGSFFAYQKLKFGESGKQEIVPEIDLTFDPEGPYALLFPRRDGNALILNIKRTASYDAISYELAYSSEGIDRGVMGTINTQEKRGEYEQEILFGTCSKNVCKYDKEVENGTLTLHIKKGKQAFRMVTLWHLQKPDVALGALSSGDFHFLYKIDSGVFDLTLLKYTIINDLTGAPKLPNEKMMVGKVYAVGVPIAKTLPAGTVSIELAEDPSPASYIARFDEVKNQWVSYPTKIVDGKLVALVDGGGIFAILTDKK